MKSEIVFDKLLFKNFQYLFILSSLNSHKTEGLHPLNKVIFKLLN
jgi:hypothetical protein